MKYLIGQAALLGLSVESGFLPDGERARYIPPLGSSHGRIIINHTLTANQACRAGMVAIGHAANGDLAPSKTAHDRAVLRSLDIILESVETEIADSPVATGTGALPIIKHARSALGAAPRHSSLPFIPSGLVASVTVMGFAFVTHVAEFAERYGLADVVA